MIVLKPGVYRHFKGMEYRVHRVVKHSETMEEFVLYEALYDNPKSQWWVRPLSMFLENVSRDDYSGPRFTYIKE